MCAGRFLFYGVAERMGFESTTFISPRAKKARLEGGLSMSIGLPRATP